jgi:septum formation protein
LPQLILASSSSYRRGLLERLGLAFEAWAPEVDETAVPAEGPRDTAKRLARSKAQAAAARFPGAWIVGSDQVAEDSGVAIGKPGTAERARAQLRAMAGRTVRFHTAVCLLAPGGAIAAEDLISVEVVFRKLTDAEIERYIAREAPLDCAGSAKVEGLGIALVERLRGDDPTALIGLPLIRLSAMLRSAGFEVP